MHRSCITQIYVSALQDVCPPAFPEHGHHNLKLSLRHGQQAILHQQRDSCIVTPLHLLSSFYRWTICCMQSSQTSHCAAFAGKARARVGLSPPYNALTPPAN
jgi:hypothetical protein